MQNETASSAFWEYGAVFKKFSEENEEKLLRSTQQVTSQRYLNQFSQYNCDVYIVVQNGIGVLLVSHDPENGPIEKFGMNQRIQIKPNVYFAILATTPELTYDLYVSPDYSLDVTTLSTPYEYRPLLPKIQIMDILGYYYRVRSPGYKFKGEKHSFFELTYVDTGTLYTDVEGQTYQLNEKELIIYGPGQFHNQYTDDNAVSYVTIMFNMENISPDLLSNWYDVLINKVFPYHKKT